MPKKSLSFPDPEPDDAARLAHRLVAKGKGLEVRALDELVGRPRRYRDLRRLVEGRSDTPLTRALGRLRRDGLVRRRSDVSQDPPVDRYELTELGSEVLFMVHNFRFLSALQAQARAGAAEASGA